MEGPEYVQPTSGPKSRKGKKPENVRRASSLHYILRFKIGKMWEEVEVRVIRCKTAMIPMMTK